MHLLILSVSDSNSSYPTLENYLFLAVKLTKMLILISINILDMVLDLIDVKFFHFLLDWWIWLQCNNFWSRYELFCACDSQKKHILILGEGPT